MSRKYFFIGVLAAGLICLLIMIRLNTESSSNKPATQLLLPFNPPGCDLPCVAGIIPGETDARQAIEQLSATYASSGPMWVLSSSDDTEILLEWLTMDPRDGPAVGGLKVLATHGQITTLGAFLDTGYVPDRVFRVRVTGPNAISLILTFENRPHVAVTVVGMGQIDQNSKIDSILVFSPTTENYQFEYQRRYHPDEIRWIGYASNEEYWQLPAQE